LEYSFHRPISNEDKIFYVHRISFFWHIVWNIRNELALRLRGFGLRNSAAYGLRPMPIGKIYCTAIRRCGVILAAHCSSKALALGWFAELLRFESPVWAALLCVTIIGMC
jgi:hypothetical protein